MRTSVLLPLLLAILLSSPHAAAEIVMSTSVVASGGETSSNTEFLVQNTIGQPFVGVADGTSHVTEIGFWNTWTGTVTGIREAESSPPIRFWMGQNHPNPFNPMTTIRYSVPERSQVTLTLYDAAGRELRTLVDGEMEPGTHETTLHAGGLASGIYFCRMSAPHHVGTRKMVLMK